MNENKEFWAMIFYTLMIIAVPAIIIAGGAWLFRIIWESDMPFWLKIILLK